MVQAVVFDFDLTLADSSPGIVECVNHAFRKMGMPPVDPGEIHQTIGLSLPRVFAALTGRSDPAGVAEFSGGFIERAEEVMADSTVIFPHVPRILSQLKTRGLRTAIVSTKFRYRIEGILARDRLTDSIDVIVGGEDVDEHKPDPESLHKALSQLKVKAADTVYVGDHPVDAEAARRARVPFIAVLSGNSVASDFHPHGVRRFLSSLEELSDSLDG